MSIKDKHIEAVKMLRNKAKKHEDKAVFCNEHHFTLDYQYHNHLGQELNYCAMKLETIFNLSYISAD